MIVTLTALALMHTASSYTRLVATGDYGSDAYGGHQAENEAKAAKIVMDLHREHALDGILALGDNNYPCKEYHSI